MGNKGVCLVIGDVHGCYEELKDLLKVAGYVRGRDRVVLAGDMVDRGPESVGVVRYARQEGFDAIIGNHDWKHLRFRKHELRKMSDPKYKIPMKPFHGVRQQEHDSLSDDDWKWLSSLPFFLRLGQEFIVVHAGMEPKPPEFTPSEIMIYVRWLDEQGKMTSGGPWKQPPNSVRWPLRWNGPENILYGHIVNSLENPMIEQAPSGATCYGLDTGCCFGGKLTAGIIADGKWQGYVQASSKGEYEQFRKDAQQ